MDLFGVRCFSILTKHAPDRLVWFSQVLPYLQNLSRWSSFGSLSHYQLVHISPYMGITQSICHQPFGQLLKLHSNLPSPNPSSSQGGPGYRVVPMYRSFLYNPAPPPPPPPRHEQVSPTVHAKDFKMELEYSIIITENLGYPPYWEG